MKKGPSCHNIAFNDSKIKGDPAWKFVLCCSFPTLANRTLYLSTGSVCPRVEHEAGTLVAGRKIFVKWQKYTHLLRMFLKETKSALWVWPRLTAVSLANLHQCCRFTSESSACTRNKLHSSSFTLEWPSTSITPQALIMPVYTVTVYTSSLCLHKQVY